MEGRPPCRPPQNRVFRNRNYLRRRLNTSHIWRRRSPAVFLPAGDRRLQAILSKHGLIKYHYSVPHYHDPWQSLFSVAARRLGPNRRNLAWRGNTTPFRSSRYPSRTDIRSATGGFQQSTARHLTRHPATLLLLAVAPALTIPTKIYLFSDPVFGSVGKRKAKIF